jgi:hypothetical protein
MTSVRMIKIVAAAILATGCVSSDPEATRYAGRDYPKCREQVQTVKNFEASSINIDTTTRRADVDAYGRYVAGLEVLEFSRDCGSDSAFVLQPLRGMRDAVSIVNAVSTVPPASINTKHGQEIYRKLILLGYSEAESQAIFAQGRAGRFLRMREKFNAGISRTPNIFGL